MPSEGAEQQSPWHLGRVRAVDGQSLEGCHAGFNQKALRRQRVSASVGMTQVGNMVRQKQSMSAEGIATGKAHKAGLSKGSSASCYPPTCWLPCCA